MRKQFAKPIDQRTIAEAMRGPDMDTRQWISYGIVTAGSDPTDIVIFDEEEGVPYVMVMLEPTKVPVRCRVGGKVAGNGEGEWFPFVQGDEVLVAIPQGDEQAGCIILCRLNNQIDKFPMDSVAGQDPTTNTFSFERRRTPLITESAGPVMIRSAITSALISIDTAGVITIKDGQSAALQMSPDIIGFQGPSDENDDVAFILQADLSGKRVTIQMGDAMMMMNASDSDDLVGATWMITPDTFVVKLATNEPVEHVLTLEAFLAFMDIMLPTMVGLTAGPLGLVALTAAVTAGGIPMSTLSGALQAGLEVANVKPKPPAVGGIQIAPGLGAVKFLTG